MEKFWGKKSLMELAPGKKNGIKFNLTMFTKSRKLDDGVSAAEANVVPVVVVAAEGHRHLEYKERTA